MRHMSMTRVALLASVVLLPLLAACSGAPSAPLTASTVSTAGTNLAGWVQAPGVPMCGGGCASKPPRPATSLTASPVPGAIVTVETLAGGPVATAKADAAGAFQLSVPPGNYKIHATCLSVGYSSGDTQAWPVHASNGTPAPIALDCPWTGPAPG
jgi:hypothetical protein